MSIIQYSSFKRNFDYFKEWFFIAVKQVFEYKWDAFSTFFNTLFRFAATLFFLYVMNNSFSTFIYWDINAIVFYMLNIYSFSVAIGVFVYSKNLSVYILRGKINRFLIRPIPIFYQYFLDTSRIRRLFVGMLYFIALIMLVVVERLSISKFIVSLFFSFLGSLFFLALILLIDSFAFFMKSNAFMIGMFYEIDDTNRMYTYSFFSNATFSNFLLFLPLTYYGVFVTEYVFGYIGFSELLSRFYLLLVMLIITTFAIYVMWRIGLKKYEAFG